MAVTITAAEPAEAVGVDSATATRLLEVAKTTVERYAPSAPAAIQGEAAIRFSGWLAEAPASGARREDTGDISTAFSPAMTGGFRASGAMALLSPFKQRRAGSI